MSLKFSGFTKLAFPMLFLVTGRWRHDVIYCNFSLSAHAQCKLYFFSLTFLSICFLMKYVGNVKILKPHYAPAVKQNVNLHSFKFYISISILIRNSKYFLNLTYLHFANLSKVWLENIMQPERLEQCNTKIFIQRNFQTMVEILFLLESP